VVNQRDKKSYTTGETEGITICQALHDEEDGTHQKQKPTQKVKSLFCLIDVQALRK